jgi:hypothetical protein
MSASPFVLPEPPLRALQSFVGHDNAPPPLRRGAVPSGADVQPPLHGVDGRAALQPTRLLLVGDDSGVGRVARASQPSLSALLARRFPHVTIVNTCRKGLCVADAAQALARGAPGRQRFDLALVLLGSSDVVQGTPPHQLAEAASALLHELQWHAAHIVWLGSGSAGHSPFLLPPMRWWANRSRRGTMRALAQAARAQGVTFIDFCPPRDAPWQVAARSAFARDGTRRDRASPLASPLECLTVLEQRVPLQAWLSGPGRSALLPNRPIQE